MFISPDTIVPDAGVLIDYNRFAYARGNSLKYNDPSGHQPWAPDRWTNFTQRVQMWWLMNSPCTMMVGGCPSLPGFDNASPTDLTKQILNQPTLGGECSNCPDLDSDCANNRYSFYNVHNKAMVLAATCKWGIK